MHQALTVNIDLAATKNNLGCNSIGYYNVNSGLSALFWPASPAACATYGVKAPALETGAAINISRPGAPAGSAGIA